MASEQLNITEAVTQVAAEAARVAVQAMATANADISKILQNTVSKIGRSIMKQSTFDWEADDKYTELKNYI